MLALCFKVMLALHPLLRFFICLGANFKYSAKEIFFWMPSNPCLYECFTEQRTATARGAANKLRGVWLSIHFSPQRAKSIIMFRLSIVVSGYCCLLSNCVTSNGHPGT